MTSLLPIKAALIDVLSTITLANGYAVEVPTGHIRGYYDASWIDDKSDATYPKVMVVVDSGVSYQLPAYQFQKTRQFLIFVFVKKLQAIEDQVATTEKFIDAIEKAIDEHSGLNGTVNNAKVTEFMTDSGILAPEGCAIIKVEVLVTE